MKKTLLFSAMLVLLSASAFAQTAPLAPAPNLPAQAPVVTTTTTTQIQPPAGSLTPPQVPSSSNAVNALQQTLNTQDQPDVKVVVQPQVPVQTPAVSTQSVPELTLPNLATTDESTLLKEASKYQAQLAFLNMISKIDKARLDMERERLKFEADKLKAAEEKAKIASATIPSISVATSTSTAPSYSHNASSSQAFAVQVDPPVIRSIYSYDGQYFAEILTGTQKTIAKIGTKLPDGSRVVEIENGMVVVSMNGKRVTLGVDTSASGFGSSQTASAPMPRPSSLPPMPPSANP